MPVSAYEGGQDKGLVDVAGVRSNQIVGYGLVAGRPAPEMAEIFA